MVVLPAACDLGQQHSWTDQGRVCLFPSGEMPAVPYARPTDSRNFVADRPLDVTVVAPTCLSSSCSHDAQASCTATVNGNQIEITSRASYVEQGNLCSADCRALEARCSTGPLPAGTYEVRHGQERLTVTVPSTVATPCAGQGLGAFGQ